MLLKALRRYNMLKVLLLVPLMFLVGCASTSDYYESVQHANDSRSKVELAKAQAEVERIRALQNISQNGDPSAQTAAVMALALTNQQTGNNNSSDTVTPRQPKSAHEVALDWAGILVPGVTSLYSINRNTAVQEQQIDANRDVRINSNRTMLGFGQLNAGNEATIVGNGDDRVLTPRNPANEAIVGDDDDVLLLPQ
jgi:hypothetical protein